jgi:hypothetical protein
MNYFNVWWNGIPANQKFSTKKDAEKYIRKMKAWKCEILEFNKEHAVVNRWQIN